jgi:hypothetical protein
MKKKTLLLTLVLLGVFGLCQVKADAYSVYSFNANDWAYTGDGGRISQGNISVSDNVITATPNSGDYNTCLKC